MIANRPYFAVIVRKLLRRHAYAGCLFVHSPLRKLSFRFLLPRRSLLGSEVEDVHGGFGQDRTKRPPLEGGNRRGSLLLAGMKGSKRRITSLASC